jgi:hypothetical protein
VLRQHLARVHPVDVVCPEDVDVVGVFVADEVEVLEYGVGRPREPVGPSPHLSRDAGDVSAQQGRHTPGLGNVPVQAVALVLGQHGDPAVAAVDQVGQREVDQPVVAGKRHGGLGAVGGERGQPFTLTPGQDDRKDPLARLRLSNCQGNPRPFSYRTIRLRVVGVNRW